MGFSVLGFSVPVFVIGYCLIYVFAIELGWLPVQGYIRIGVDFWRLPRAHDPAVASRSASIYIALIARITRASVLEVLNEDYIRTARAKGLSNRVVLMRHALRNAAVPILTVIGIGIALLIGGAVVTESVFGLPGPRPAHGRGGAEPRLPDHPGRHPAVLRRLRRDQPADRHQLHPVRPEDPLLSAIAEDVVDSAAIASALDQAPAACGPLAIRNPSVIFGGGDPADHAGDRRRWRRSSAPSIRRASIRPSRNKKPGTEITFRARRRHDRQARSRIDGHRQPRPRRLQPRALRHARVADRRRRRRR